MVHPITEILALEQLAPSLWWDLAYVVLVTLGVGFLAVKKLRGRLVD